MGKVLSFAVALTIMVGALADAAAANATVPSMVGKTYGEAQGLLSKWKLASEITTTLGTELSRNDCIVVNQQLRPASHFGAINSPAKLLLSLDCTAVVASATHPGNSAGSPEGRAAKQAEILAWWRTNTPEGQAWCTENQSAHPNWDWSLIKGCPK
ncbi:hypothetical protein [Mycolicibacterium sp. CBMA 226]|uniref:hypothetical protein n=1 Tax=Mycolicibacterium sp. CBMA 226 TaxID=2606611 RepID=UPI0012DF6D32|nr:hypothetical protein [Mycolicibacterium sp. CBMA 226]MUL76161.1 hypothetical protein [Mycolicibacterium sp. CBMA 226]